MTALWWLQPGEMRWSSCCRERGESRTKHLPEIQLMNYPALGLSNIVWTPVKEMALYGTMSMAIAMLNYVMQVTLSNYYQFTVLHSTHSCVSHIHIPRQLHLCSCTYIYTSGEQGPELQVAVSIHLSWAQWPPLEHTWPTVGHVQLRPAGTRRHVLLAVIKPYVTHVRPFCVQSKVKGSTIQLKNMKSY